jgi:hypothetical protein
MERPLKRTLTFDNGMRGAKRCCCNECPRCKDNARWEEIFERKFGEQMRAYYAPRPLRMGVSAEGLTEAAAYFEERASPADRRRKSAYRQSETGWQRDLDAVFAFPR